MSEIPELVEIDDAVSMRGDVLILNFEAIGPKGHTSEKKPWLFRPGESGNPTGRPQIKLLSKAYRRRLSELSPDGRTYAEVIAGNIIELAMGETRLTIQAASELADRTEGKPRQTIESTIHVSLAERIQRARQSIGASRVIDVRPIGELTGHVKT